MKIKIEVPLLEGQSLDAAKLNDALRAAGLTFNGFHHAQAAIVECDPADEAQVRAIIEAHLAESDKRAHNAPIDEEIAEIERQNLASARGQREVNIALALICDKLNVIIAQIEAALDEVRDEVNASLPAEERIAPAVIDRLNDLKANAGMKKQIEADAAIRAKRKQRI